MKITFLGTGTSQGIPVIGSDHPVCLSTDPRDKRLRSSIHIQTDELSLVVDTGPDFRQQMLRSGVKRLDAVLFTHEHKDHTAGFDDIRPYNFMQKEAMEVYGSKGLCTALKRDFYYVFEENKYPGAPSANLHEIDKDPFEIKGQKIIPIEVLHYRLPVLGFRIDDFTYITDAKYIAEEEKDKVRGSKVLVLNALRREDHISHFTLNEALELIHELQPEKAYLTHLSHLMGFHAEVEAELPSNIHVAYDGLEISC